MKSKPMARSDDKFRKNLTAEQNKTGFYLEQQFVVSLFYLVSLVCSDYLYIPEVVVKKY